MSDTSCPATNSASASAWEHWDSGSYGDTSTLFGIECCKATCQTQCTRLFATCDIIQIMCRDKWVKRPVDEVYYSCHSTIASLVIGPNVDIPTRALSDIIEASQKPCEQLAALPGIVLLALTIRFPIFSDGANCGRNEMDTIHHMVPTAATSRIF